MKRPTDREFLRLVASHFEGVRKTPSGGYRANCPAHPDERPSLVISMGQRPGRVLLKCFANCEISTILASVGLQFRDLFNRPGQSGSKVSAAAEFDNERRDYLAEAILSRLPAPASEIMGDSSIQAAAVCAGSTSSRDRKIRRVAVDLGVVPVKQSMDDGWLWLPPDNARVRIRSVTYAVDVSPSSGSPAKESIHEGDNPPKGTSMGADSSENLVPFEEIGPNNEGTVSPSGKRAEIGGFDLSDFSFDAVGDTRAITASPLPSWGPAWRDLAILTADDLLVVQEAIHVFAGQVVAVRTDEVPEAVTDFRAWGSQGGHLDGSLE